MTSAKAQRDVSSLEEEPAAPKAVLPEAETEGRVHAHPVAKEVGVTKEKLCVDKAALGVSKMEWESVDEGPTKGALKSLKDRERWREVVIHEACDGAMGAAAAEAHSE
jgi:hypothetical protein